jgi:Tfp pilus assembly protein PilN
VAVTYALLAIVGLLAVAFLLREPYQQRVYASQIQQEISKLEPEVKSLVKEEAELGSVVKQYDILLGHYRRRDANLQALNTLAATLPSDTFLLNYRYQDDTVTVTGVSASALAVQTALENTPVFRDVQLASPITRDPTGKDRFALKMVIEVAR